MNVCMVYWVHSNDHFCPKLVAREKPGIHFLVVSFFLAC